MLKKHIIFLAFATFVTMGLHAQNQDTTNVQNLDEVVINGVRLQKNAPFSVTNIEKVELSDFSKTGQELPFLFAKAPSIYMMPRARSYSP